MDAKTLIRTFGELKHEDPERFYKCLGYDVDIMDGFIGGSYELGIIVGAMYALERLNKRQDE